jgi:signal transduction histidine kinase
MGPAADGSRTALVTALLLVSLVAAALLAWQAHHAATSHRNLAESVLRDDASLVASELGRRAVAEVGYYGCYPLVAALEREARRGGLGPETLDALRKDGDDGVRRASQLSSGLVVGRSLGDRLALSGATLEPATASWLADRVATRPIGKAARFFTVSGVLDGRARVFVVRQIEPSPDGTALVGFELDLSQLSDWLSTARARSPLLPKSLVHGELPQEAIAIEVMDAAGIMRYRAGGGPWLELGFDGPFSDSELFQGMRIRASLDPAVADRLVIGGLPESRLSLQLGLLAVAVGLTATALLQLGRERALQRLRSEFVSSVSHELRTPLTQIRMFAETLLLGRVRSPDESRRALEIVDREARRLSQLVDNVLLFSRVERGTVALQPEPQRLAPLVREVIETLRPQTTDAGARMLATLEDGPTAAVDADAFRQILINLLDNALKYGPPGQAVEIVLRGDGDVARLSVADEGPGIPPGDRERVFERFRRLEHDRRSAVAGTGIGLAVVRDLVSRQGGRSFVEAGERGGARFVVELALVTPGPDRRSSPESAP